MVMKALRDGAKGGVTKFILFGFLGLATGGLVMMDVGGFFRGGITDTDVARVGSKSISIQSFDRNLRRTLSRLGMTPQEAYKLGYVNQVLAGDVRALLLNEAASDLGVEVPDSVVAEQIKTLVQPMVTPDSNAKDVLFQILRSQGMSEGELANSIARDIGNNLVAQTLESSLSAPSEQMLIDLYKSQNEKRDIEYVTFLNKDMKDTPAPTDEQLQNLYNATKESYASPETRTFKIVTVDTAALKKSVSISDEEIQDNYDSNIDLYKTPAKWTLDQVLVPTKDQADKIYAAAKSGALENAVQKVTTNKSGYIGTQDVDESGLLDEIKDAVLANETKGKLLEPVKSPLGWHIVKIKDMKAARTRPLSEVRKEIKDELTEALIIDQQYELANNVDDMLAGGSSLEEVAETIDLKIESLPPLNSFGLNNDNKDGLKNFTANREMIIETGYTLEEGETSPIFETADGEFMAVYLDVITPKSYKPFEELKGALKIRWEDDQNRISNQARVRAALIEMSTNGKTLKDFGTVKSKKNIGRSDTLGKPLLQHTIANIFEGTINQPVVLGVEGGAAIAVVTNYNWPKIDTNSAEFKTFKNAIMNDAKNEALGIYLTAQQRESKAEINQKLLDQVYSPASQDN